MPSNGPDELDHLLDSALSAYGPQQAPPGIAQRVLSRLPSARPRRVWWLVAMPALAAGLAVMVLLLKPEPSANVRRSAEPESLTFHTPAPLLPTKAVVGEQRARRFRRVRPSLTKAAIFPTPAPPTEEERAVMELGASMPQTLHNAEVSRQNLNQPLTVEPIKIAPLELGGSLED